MKNNNIEELVLAWLDNAGNRLERDKIEAELKALDYDIKQLYELQKMNGMMLKVKEPVPGHEMDEKFYAMLDSQERVKVRHSQRRLMSFKDLILPEYRIISAALYGLLLLFIGWFMGHHYSSKSVYEQQLTSMHSELRNMKSMMTLTLLEHPSYNERLQGIYTVNSLDSLDNTIIHALLMTLNNDPNKNVRLMTIQSLMRFTDYPMVREGLVHAISTQKDPQILLLLADVMVSIHESESVTSFEQLLAKGGLETEVEDKIKKSILTLL